MLLGYHCSICISSVPYSGYSWYNKSQSFYLVRENQIKIAFGIVIIIICGSKFATIIKPMFFIIKCVTRNIFFCHFSNKNRFQMRQLSKYRQSLDEYFSGLQFGTNPEFLAQFIEKLLQFKCISWWKKVTQQPFSLSFPPSQFRNAQNRPKRPEKKALSSKNSLEKILSCAPNLKFWAPFPPPYCRCPFRYCSCC